MGYELKNNNIQLKKNEMIKEKIEQNVEIRGHIRICKRVGSPNKINNGKCRRCCLNMHLEFFESLNIIIILFGTDILPPFRTSVEGFLII